MPDMTNEQRELCGYICPDAYVHGIPQHHEECPRWVPDDVLLEDCDCPICNGDAAREAREEAEYWQSEAGREDLEAFDHALSKND